MKSISKFLFGMLMISSISITCVCCSSSDGGDDPVIPDPYPEQDDMTGIYQMGDYTLSLYNNNTFDATDGTNNVNGVYCYSNPTLSISGISAGLTRAFTLEVGKTYTFEVTRGSDNAVTLKDSETGEVYTMERTGDAPEKSEKLTAEQEKMFIETTARTLEHYFVADEIKEYTDLYNELKDVKAGDLEDFIKNYTVETLLNTRVDTSYYCYSSTYWDYNIQDYKPIYYIYNYITTTKTYDKVITLSNVQGQYEATANGSWKQTSKTGDLKLTYTAKDGSQWVLAVTHEGSTGEFKFSNEDDNYSSSSYSSIDKNSIPAGDSIYSQTYKWTYNNKTNYYNVPTKATATLTHNGDTRVSIAVNVTKFEAIKDKVLSLTGQCNGNGTVEIKTTGDPFKVTSEFSYANGANSTASALLTKGTKNLIKADASATSVASTVTNGEINDVTNANATITIMNTITVKASFNNGKTIYDAYDNATSYSNRYDGTKVQGYIDQMNSNFTAYFLNKSNSSVSQGNLIAKMTSEDYTYYSYVSGQYTYQTKKRYYVEPALSFDDGTSYIFSDYFTESVFQKVIDYAKNLRDNVQKMVDAE